MLEYSIINIKQYLWWQNNFMYNYLRFGYFFMRCVYVQHVNFAWKNIYVCMCICKCMLYVLCCMLHVVYVYENEIPYNFLWFPLDFFLVFFILFISHLYKFHLYMCIMHVLMYVYNFVYVSYVVSLALNYTY